jgi:hypothetical protein
MSTQDAGAGFLSGFPRRPVELDAADLQQPVELFLGQGPMALEVIVARAHGKPGSAHLRDAWRRRQGGRGVPLVLVALHGGRAALCGPSGEEPPTYANVDATVAERVCATALRQPSRHAALRFLYGVLPHVESELPGIRNEGFLTLHELVYGVAQRPDFAQATGQAEAALAQRGLDLVQALGFEADRLDDYTYLLVTQERRRAIAVLLRPDEAPDIASPRLAHLSPVSYALSIAERENVPYVLLVTDTGLRLHPVRDGVGVAQRGRTETFVEVNLDLVPADRAGYLWLLFSAAALAEGGTLEGILERARDHAAHVGTELRKRIHAEVMPALAMAIWQARGIKKPTADDCRVTYQIALTLLFRLLFIAYAEDKELLPYRTNEAYRRRSLKELARELHRLHHDHVKPGAGASYWNETRELCHAVDEGLPEWGVPAYNGGLFSAAADVSAAGAALESIALPNDSFVDILRGLLVEEASPEGDSGPVDFSALGVREFGTIYEGLLENEIAIADTDLTVRRVGDREMYWPVEEKTRKRAEVVVRKGEAYLHTASGARKATGSYYTKPFAVEHLLNHALEAAIAAHMERLDGLDEGEAAEAFFDFRVADIAMGSGHFLVAAVDRMERHFAQYLARRPLPAVREELSRLRAAAHEALGPAGEGVTIEDTQLLRRQIARRCIYGVDINPLAVQLARVSLWIHTFVPGLPLSFLDHNLIEGNSLVGIATIDEAREELSEYAPGLFAVNAETLLGAAREPLERLAHITDADAREIEAARRALVEAQQAIEPTRALFDVLTAARLDADLADRLHIGRRTEALKQWREHPEEVLASPEWESARATLADLPPTHFPVAFPEVFLRGDGEGGFDCILGNPPWEEATVEEDRFWTRHFPGLHSLPEREKQAEVRKHGRQRPDLVVEYEAELTKAEALREALVVGPFPGMGTGDPDVYKAFCWRYMQLVRQSRWTGVVLPRSAFCAKGSTDFRQHLFAEGRIGDLTFLLNRGRWVFDDQHPQYTVALLSAANAHVDPAELPMRGPFTSRASFDAGVAREPVRFRVSEAAQWTDSAALPLLLDEESLEVFVQLRRAQRFDLDDGKSWRARPHTELHATNDKPLMDLRSKECPPGSWPVFKGESFDIWQPDTGTYYAWANPKKLLKHLQDKRLRSGGHSKSPFCEFPASVLRDPKTLPCLHPRIAFRDVTNRTNRRTVVVALIPPEVFATNKGPYLLWPRGGETEQAHLVGVMSSIPLDWYARRFVETAMNFHILNPFPVPRPSRDDPLGQRTVQLAGRLAAPDERFAEWAEKVGVGWGPIPDLQKDDMIAELDAVVAHLYGLTERQLIHIFETFHEGWDYEERLRAVLGHFKGWGNAHRKG